MSDQNGKSNKKTAPENHDHSDYYHEPPNGILIGAVCIFIIPIFIALIIQHFFRCELLGDEDGMINGGF